MIGFTSKLLSHPGPTREWSFKYLKLDVVSQNGINKFSGKHIVQITHLNYEKISRILCYCILICLLLI